MIQEDSIDGIKGCTVALRNKNNGFMSFGMIDGAKESCIRMWV